MGTTLVRAVSGVVGVVVALIALLLALMFISNEFQEAESASHPLLMDLVVISIVVAFLVGCGLGAFLLLRFAITGQRLKVPDEES
jgi:hypothetical protein